MDVIETGLVIGPVAPGCQYRGSDWLDLHCSDGGTILRSWL